MPIEHVKGLEGCVCHHPNLVNLYGCDIGEGCKIGAFVEIGEGVVIGKMCKIQSFAFIPPGVTIGDWCFIGPHAVFCNTKYPDMTKPPVILKTVVEDHVCIGAGAVILPGVRIGKGAMIGAGAIVTKDVAAGETVIGHNKGERV
jgi:UDP-2-acetamido-3-amino-2,3-dideoxy-glucuronate N-acetyltransferase